MLAMVTLIQKAQKIMKLLIFDRSREPPGEVIHTLYKPFEKALYVTFLFFLLTAPQCKGLIAPWEAAPQNPLHPGGLRPSSRLHHGQLRTPRKGPII